MSDNVVPFNGEQEENCCETCDLIHEFMEYVKTSESDEALFDTLSALVSEAKTIGVKDYLIAEIGGKMKLLDHLEGVCDCEDCE